jgi:hypothetical protein
MLETIINVKNNKFKSGEMATRQSDKEMVAKMKKFLNGLGKKRTVRSAEPLRVSLDDINQINTKGKGSKVVFLKLTWLLSRQMVVGGCIVEGQSRWY